MIENHFASPLGETFQEVRVGGISQTSSTIVELKRPFGDNTGIALELDRKILLIIASREEDEVRERPVGRCPVDWRKPSQCPGLRIGGVT